jgi:DNA modification methylase
MDLGASSDQNQDLPVNIGSKCVKIENQFEYIFKIEKDTNMRNDNERGTIMNDSKRTLENEELRKRLLDVLSSNTIDKPTKDFSFYWSKKSPQIAGAIYKAFAENNSVILDPFVGSGSALYGINLCDKNLKFVGVDINQLPIAFIHFNMQELSNQQIEKMQENLQIFIEQNSSTYKYKLDSDSPFDFKKVHFDKQMDLIAPTYFEFVRKDKTIKITSADGALFDTAKKLYLEKIAEAKMKNQLLPDLKLGANSRIAIKPGMMLSDIFSPITFNLLLAYKKFAKNDLDLAILLSTCLHLCRITDTRSQSQFPYWIPKTNAVDRNIFELLQGKLIQLTKIMNSRNESKTLHKNVKKAHSFNELTSMTDPSYLLINSPIQNVSASDIPNSSIDLVFTDPPYFDQVAYSEYLVIWQFFTDLQVDLENEIIESNRENYQSDRLNYLLLLSEGFKVISKKLKNNHFAIVYFKDSKLKNISDFLQIMEDSHLEYLTQIHVPKPKFTYKQNTSQENTVEGDSLYVFLKNTSINKIDPQFFSKEELENEILRLICEYLDSYGKATPSKILDDWVIPRLWNSKMLHLVDDSTFPKIIDKFFYVDKETREVIGSK